MKSKNILPNVKKKSLSESQDEIKEIISHLEDSETNLGESIEKYQRMIQLDNHIKKEFKSKNSKIKKIFLDKNGKIVKKDHE